VLPRPAAVTTTSPTVLAEAASEFWLVACARLIWSAVCGESVFAGWAAGAAVCADATPAPPRHRPKAQDSIRAFRLIIVSSPVGIFAGRLVALLTQKTGEGADALSEAGRLI
jgi:hypothetical protein